MQLDGGGCKWEVIKQVMLYIEVQNDDISWDLQLELATALKEMVC